MRLVWVVVVAVATIAVGAASPPQAQHPVRPLRFAVIGNSGTGDASVREFGDRLYQLHTTTPLDLVITTGGNVNGTRPQDFARRFEEPFSLLLKADVRFQAALGKRDPRENVNYAHFQMGGRAYYAHRPRPDIACIALDTPTLDPAQLAWFEKALADTPASAWKIVHMYDPIYSSAADTPIDDRLRRSIEPLLVAHGVDVVFAGREAVYERLVPQASVTHVVVGSTGSLDRGRIDAATRLTARGYDQDRVAVLATVAGDTMRLTAMTPGGDIVDDFSIGRR